MNAQTLTDRKLNLIVQIAKISDEESVRHIEDAISNLKTKGITKKQRELLEKLARPMREKLDIEQLIKEQNWKPIDREEFDKLIKEMDIQEPLEQLIADIGK
jgi:hypothetical protein